jgi:hypothetical protein
MSCVSRTVNVRKTDNTSEYRSQFYIKKKIRNFILRDDL